MRNWKDCVEAQPQLLAGSPQSQLPKDDLETIEQW